MRGNRLRSMSDLHESVLHAHHGNDKDLNCVSAALDRLRITGKQSSYIHAQRNQDNEGVESEQRFVLGHATSHQLVLNKIQEVHVQEGIHDQVNCLLTSIPNCVDMNIPLTYL
jgi:hypothetical protein